MNVRTSELVKKICNILNEERNISLMIISIQFGVRVVTAHRGCEHAQKCSRVLGGEQNERLIGDSREMTEAHQNCPSFSIESRPFCL